MAQAITDAGLADYYRYEPRRPCRSFVSTTCRSRPSCNCSISQKCSRPSCRRRLREGSRADTGEHHLRRMRVVDRKTHDCLAGVRGVEINHATRARVTWDETHIRLSAILQAIADIGYRAQPYDAVRSDEIHRAERRQALWRLFVAGFGSMQVMMVASTVYFADGDMTRDIEMLMRWASLVLTTPVVFYSAGVFFKTPGVI